MKSISIIKDLSFNLYGTDGCHLCEIAEDLCKQVFTAQQYCYVDIIDSVQLIELYSISIPVLEHLTSGNTLFWPFDLQQLQEFIRGTN